MPELPVSTALQEASPDSVNDYMNRATEDIPEEGIDAIILALRANRARVEAAEQAGVSTKVRNPRRSPKLEIRGDVSSVVLDPNRKFEL